MKRGKVILVFSSGPDFIIFQLLKKKRLDHWQFLFLEEFKEIVPKLKSEDMVIYLPENRLQSLVMIKQRKKTMAKEILFGGFNESLELMQGYVSQENLENLEYIDYINDLLAKLV